MPIYDESVNAYVKNAPKRQAELTDLAAKAAADNAAAIAKLKELGVGVATAGIPCTIICIPPIDGWACYGGWTPSF